MEPGGGATSRTSRLVLRQWFVVSYQRVSAPWFERLRCAGVPLGVFLWRSLGCDSEVELPGPRPGVPFGGRMSANVQRETTFPQGMSRRQAALPFC